MVAFMAFKRMQGHDYRDGERQLRRFDAFLGAAGCADGVLRMRDVDRYRATMAGRSVRTRCGALSPIRQFSLYLHAMEPRSERVPVRLFPRQARPIRFHRLSPAQVAGLMDAAPGVLGDGPAAHGIRFLIGLLYSTGLRISEAVALNAGDVDFERATLFVRRGKFRKERLVPMSPSTSQAAREWIERRAPCAGGGGRDPLLVGPRNRRLTRTGAERRFRRLCLHVGLASKPPPRLHDLRHNYACRRIALWRQAREDVDALLPVLANAMGHVDFFSTQVYLHIDADGLQQASAKFHAHSHPEPSK
jgi:site-specific recombinase XerD